VPREVFASDASGGGVSFVSSLYERVRSTQVVRDGAIVFAASMVLNVGAVVFHAIVSRKLGVAAYGALYAIVSLVLLAGLPASIVNTVVAKFAAEFRALHDDAHVRALTLTVCKVFSAGLLIYVVGGVALAGAIGAFLHVSYGAVVLAALMAGALVLVFALRGIAQGTQDFRGLAEAFVMDGGLKATLGAVLATAKLGLAGGIFGFFAGTILSGVYTMWRVWRRYGRAPHADFRVDVSRVLATTAAASSLSASSAILSFGDVVMVKHFFTAHDAGVYAAASLAGKILLFMVGFAPMVLIPKAAYSHARRENALPALSGAMLMVFVLSGVGLLGFLVAGKAILHVLVGPQFVEAAPLLPTYGLAMALLGVTTVVASYAIALHRFAFSLPLVVLAVGEIVAIGFYHPTLFGVVTILVTGNALALVAVSIASLRRSHEER
jgi:O-antigen/teichoic acid export membrane protein